MKKSILIAISALTLAGVQQANAQDQFACKKSKKAVSCEVSIKRCNTPSANYMQPRITLIGGPEQNTVFQTGENTTVTSGTNYSAGLLLSTASCHGLSLQSGAIYRTVGYNVNVAPNPNIQTLVPQNTLDYNVNYTALEIPLLADIRFGSCSQFSYGARMGASYSMMLNNSSTFQEVNMPDNVPTKANDVQAYNSVPANSTNIIVNPYVEMGICSSTSVQLGAMVRMNTNATSGTINQPYSLGLNLGISKTLNCCASKKGSCTKKSDKKDCPSRKGCKGKRKCGTKTSTEG